MSLRGENKKRSKQVVSRTNSRRSGNLLSRLITSVGVSEEAPKTESKRGFRAFERKASEKLKPSRRIARNRVEPSRAGRKPKGISRKQKKTLGQEQVQESKGFDPYASGMTSEPRGEFLSEAAKANVLNIGKQGSSWCFECTQEQVSGRCPHPVARVAFPTGPSSVEEAFRAQPFDGAIPPFRVPFSPAISSSQEPKTGTPRTEAVPFNQPRKSPSEPPPKVALQCHPLKKMAPVATPPSAASSPPAFAHCDEWVMDAGSKGPSLPRKLVPPHAAFLATASPAATAAAKASPSSKPLVASAVRGLVEQRALLAQLMGTSAPGKSSNQEQCAPPTCASPRSSLSPSFAQLSFAEGAHTAATEALSLALSCSPSLRLPSPPSGALPAGPASSAAAAVSGAAPPCQQLAWLYEVESADEEHELEAAVPASTTPTYNVTRQRGGGHHLHAGSAGASAVAAAVASSSSAAAMASLAAAHGPTGSGGGTSSLSLSAQAAASGPTPFSADDAVARPPRDNHDWWQPVVVSVPPALRDQLATLPFLEAVAQREGSPAAAAAAGDSTKPCEAELCVFCMDAFADCDLVTRLPCAHLFHPGCITTWLSEYKNSCPVCRAIVDRPAVAAATAQAEQRVAAGARATGYMGRVVVSGESSEGGIASASSGAGSSGDSSENSSSDTDGNFSDPELTSAAAAVPSSSERAAQQDYTATSALRAAAVNAAPPLPASVPAQSTVASAPLPVQQPVAQPVTTAAAAAAAAAAVTAVVPSSSASTYRSFGGCESDTETVGSNEAIQGSSCDEGAAPSPRAPPVPATASHVALATPQPLATACAAPLLPLGLATAPSTPRGLRNSNSSSNGGSNSTGGAYPPAQRGSRRRRRRRRVPGTTSRRESTLTAPTQSSARREQERRAAASASSRPAALTRRRSRRAAAATDRRGSASRRVSSSAALSSSVRQPSSRAGGSSRTRTSSSRRRSAAVARQLRPVPVRSRLSPRTMEAIAGSGDISA